MQESSSLSSFLYANITQFFRIRKRLFLSLLLIAAALAVLIFPYISSYIKNEAALSWEKGWDAWKRREPKEALECWSHNSFITELSRRPAKFLYWRIRALESLGRTDEALELRADMMEKYPMDLYTFMISPNGGFSEADSPAAKKEALMFHPRPWKNEVEAASKLTGTAEITIFALMKRESKFHSKAISQSGAVGLMQLMPATAEDEAQKLKISADIYEPEDNILLGANHFSMLEHKFSNEPIKAVAAYNAGAKTVARWGALSSQDWAEWIESIPYAETREFVRSVLQNREVYRILYGGSGIPLAFIINKTPSETKTLISMRKK